MEPPWTCLPTWFVTQASEFAKEGAADEENRDAAITNAYIQLCRGEISSALGQLKAFQLGITSQNWHRIHCTEYCQSFYKVQVQLVSRLLLSLHDPFLQEPHGQCCCAWPDTWLLLQTLTSVASANWNISQFVRSVMQHVRATEMTWFGIDLSVPTEFFTFFGFSICILHNRASLGRLPQTTESALGENLLRPAEVAATSWLQLHI